MITGFKQQKTIHLLAYQICKFIKLNHDHISDGNALIITMSLSQSNGIIT